jgi:hypothetical protein
MGYYTYQNKAWAIMESKIEKMEDKEVAEQFKKLMSESASEAFKKPTKTEDVADLLMDAVNSSSFDNETFAKQITGRTHRTLQQSFFRAFMDCVDEWDNYHKENMFDLRNEATVKASTKIKEALKDDYLPLV